MADDRRKPGRIGGIKNVAGNINLPDVPKLPFTTSARTPFLSMGRTPLSTGPLSRKVARSSFGRPTSSLGVASFFQGVETLRDLIRKAV